MRCCMGSMNFRARLARRSGDGAAAVEFALVSVLLFTLLFGMMQYGVYFWALQSGSHAAREAARQAAVGDLTCAEFNAAVLDNAQAEVAGTVEATREYYTDATLATEAPAATTGGAVKVTVAFESLDFGFPFVPFIADGQVHEEAVARVENVTGESVECT